MLIVFVFLFIKCKFIADLLACFDRQLFDCRCYLGKMDTDWSSNSVVNPSDKSELVMNMEKTALRIFFKPKLTDMA